MCFRVNNPVEYGEFPQSVDSESNVQDLSMRDLLNFLLENT